MRLFKILRRSPALILIHAALIIIIIGGSITALTARDEMVVLRPDEPVNIDGLTLELKEFRTTCYPGGSAPRNYESDLLVNGKPHTLAVNDPLTAGRWKLYQSSFTPDGCSVISMRSDRPGTAIVFIGYALFALGGLLATGRRLRALVIIGCVALGANALPAVTAEAADSLARVAVNYHGQTVTYSTVARDVMNKVYGKTSYRGLSAERVVTSLTLFANEWNSVPLIKTSRGHIAFNDCFDADGNYLLSDDPEADERVGVILLLRAGQLFRMAAPGYAPPYPNLEVLYNRIPSTLIIFITLFIAAAIGFLMPRHALLPGAIALAMQIAVIVVQCMLTGHGPFNSTFETLQFLVAVVTLLALIIPGLPGPGFLAAGCMALVAHLQASNPVVTPMMPVLHSPWLALHVSLVMTSYAMLIVVAVAGICGLAGNADAMRRRCSALLRPALYLLGMGIITGSIWANQSWGRYWGWDPKETWALITFLIYAIPVHLRRPSLWWYILPLLSVAMTYFGVSLLPSSLHSY